MFALLSRCTTLPFADHLALLEGYCMHEKEPLLGDAVLVSHADLFFISGRLL